MEEGKTSSQDSATQRFSQPHPAVQRSEYQQAALLLGSREFSSLSVVRQTTEAMISQSLLLCTTSRDIELPSLLATAPPNNICGNKLRHFC